MPLSRSVVTYLSLVYDGALDNLIQVIRFGPNGSRVNAVWSRWPEKGFGIIHFKLENMHLLEATWLTIKIPWSPRHETISNIKTSLASLLCLFSTYFTSDCREVLDLQTWLWITSNSSLLAVWTIKLPDTLLLTIKPPQVSMRTPCCSQGSPRS